MDSEWAVLQASTSTKVQIVLWIITLVQLASLLCMQHQSFLSQANTVAELFSFSAYAMCNRSTGMLLVVYYYSSFYVRMYRFCLESFHC